MLYLSQIINKPIFSGDKQPGKVVDLAVHGTKHPPEVCKVIVKSGKKKFLLPAESINFANNRWIITNESIERTTADEKDFYLVEDLLDKQVIDTKGKRLVRVNDVLLEKNGVLKLQAIDVGFAGILRRSGFGNLFNLKIKTLSWQLLQAFDYDTGAIKLKLSETGLQQLHPVEIAHILEDAGSKERLGVLDSLDSKHAASALERANTSTQTAILKEATSTQMKSLLDVMHSFKLADMFQFLNPFASRHFLSLIESDKAKKIEKLMVYEDDVAGGLMDESFFKELKDTTIGNLLATLEEKRKRPEEIIVVDIDETLVGTVHTKDLINHDNSRRLETLVTHTLGVRPDTSFAYILHQFDGYNLRVLPVVDTNRKILGVITTETIITRFVEETKEHHGY